VDPLAEQYPSPSPYNYVSNNPISNIDPTGMWTESASSYTTNDPDEISAFMRQMRAGQSWTEWNFELLPMISVIANLDMIKLRICTVHYAVLQESREE